MNKNTFTPQFDDTPENPDTPEESPEESSEDTISADEETEHLSPEEKQQLAYDDMQLLLKHGVWCLVTGIVVLGALSIGGDAWVTDFTVGFVVAGSLALLNLWALGRAVWMVIQKSDEEVSLLQVGGLVLGALIAMLVVGWIIAQYRAEYLLGFSVGLALPIPAGFSWSIARRRRQQPPKKQN